MSGDVRLTKAQRRLVRDSEAAARLIAKVCETANGCWEWIGSRGHKGYGFMHLDGRAQRAHRASYQLFCGPIPDGMLVCHHCDNPPCVNPLHLFIGTRSDNMRDMMRKGRANRVITSAQVHFRAGRAPNGERASGAKLSREQAEGVIRDRASGLRLVDLMAKYDCGRSTVQDLINRRSWPDLDRSELSGRQALAATPGASPGGEKP